MQEEKFGKLIKDIRKKYHLTQKELADKYHVTYQAVSKWENGKNLPDITLMKQISEDYNMRLDDMIDGKMTKKKKNNLIFVLLLVCIIGLIILVVVKSRNDDFESKSIISTCKDYKISGVIAYNKSKSVIYIPKIEYCGAENREKYKDISCTLYEKNGNITKEVSTFNYNESLITISDFMKLVSFNVDNYLKICSNYKDSFYLDIKAIDVNNKVYFHTIPLVLEKDCN